MEAREGTRGRCCADIVHLCGGDMDIFREFMAKAGLHQSFCFQVHKG